VTARIEVYRRIGDAPFRCFGLEEIVRPVMEALLSRPLDGTRFAMTLTSEPDNPLLPGSPAMYNLLPDYAFATVCVFDGDQIVYRHPHTIEELIATPLQARLGKEFPSERQWFYRIAGPGIPHTIVRPAPMSEGAFETLSSGYPELGVNLNLRRIEEPDPPEMQLSDFGAPESGPSAVTVLLDEKVAEGLQRTARFSHDVEEGGFLTGLHFRRKNLPQSWVILVRGIPVAKHTGASLLHFTFTGDSFRDMKQTLSLRSDEERLLGWYHTHLFAPTASFGLSSIDVGLHISTFRQPWQVAGLINLERGRRTIRFYTRSGGLMIQCPMWVIGGPKVS
jgi:hypothetical protein